MTLLWTERWQSRAACLGVPDAVFFDEHSYGQARAIWSSCTVITQCRRQADHDEAGLHARDMYGILAGESPVERARRRAG